MKTIIPARAVCKLDIRLVVDQRADDVYEQLVRHVRRHAPDVEVRKVGFMEPSRTPVGNPYVKVVARAVERAPRREAANLPLLRRQPAGLRLHSRSRPTAGQSPLRQPG